MSSLRLIPVICNRSKGYQIQILLIKCVRICSTRSVFVRSNLRSVNSQPSMMRLAFVILVLIINFESISAIFKTGRNADSENDSYKIYNGFASMLRFPYAVKIFSRGNQQTLSGFSCSGSIVHQLWILTAAHCVYGFKVFDVFIGNVTNDANHVVRAAHTFIHPNYTFEPELSNDIALVKLKRSLETLNNSKLRLYS